MTLYDYIRRPVRFDYLAPLLGHSPEPMILDVGCGNNSAVLTKRYYPRCRYHGIDRPGAHRPGDENARYMERFVEMDLEGSSLGEFEDGYYDCIILSHVIEHLRTGAELLEGLVHKLRSGGILYIETPHPRSLRFPSMRGTLNFWDDPTHVRIYAPDEMTSLLQGEGIEILRAGTRRSAKRILITPLHGIHAIIKHGRLDATLLWDLLGFATVVIGKKSGR